MKNLVQVLWSDDSGQGMVEYSLIVAVVAVGLIAAFMYIRNSAGGVLDAAADSLKAQPAGGYVPSQQ